MKRLDPKQFVRVHRSAIVNLDRVRRIRVAVQGESGVFLLDGTHVPLSRRRRDDLVAELRRRQG